MGALEGRRELKTSTFDISSPKYVFCQSIVLDFGPPKSFSHRGTRQSCPSS